MRTKTGRAGMPRWPRRPTPLIPTLEHLGRKKGRREGVDAAAAAAAARTRRRPLVNAVVLQRSTAKVADKTCRLLVFSLSCSGAELVAFYCRYLRRLSGFYWLGPDCGMVAFYCASEGLMKVVGGGGGGDCSSAPIAVECGLVGGAKWMTSSSIDSSSIHRVGRNVSGVPASPPPPPSSAVSMGRTTACPTQRGPFCHTQKIRSQSLSRGQSEPEREREREK